ncbi:MAG: signal peptidase I, partial [Verrucomicrobia bacterium]|nr:signal peptidase I [Verrucomicrobiota bacterium]
DGIRLVKRVVALPGDQVELRDNQLWLNGKPAQYRPITAVAIHFIDHPPSPASILAEESLDQHPHPVMWLPGRPSKSTFGPLVIPEGKYFLMGDNRDNSKDSRYFGCVEERRVLGRVQGTIVSFNKLDWYQPRLSRFFSRLE